MTLYEFLRVATATTVVDILNGEDIVISNVSIINAQIPFYLLSREVDFFYPALLKTDDSDCLSRSKIVIHMLST